MEAHVETERHAASSAGAAVARRRSMRLRVALLGLLPIALIAGVAALFAALGTPGLGERSGPPVEELAVERTTLRPGQIELRVRNDGPDSVRVAQVIVNDAFVGFATTADEIDRLRAATITIEYPWVEGEAYEIALLTSLGATVDHAVPVAVETPSAGWGFYGLMAVIGTYVGIIPVALGMLWLPWLRRVGRRWLPAIMAFTVGLLVFLAVDATLEGIEVAGTGAQAFGGAALVVLGAATAFAIMAAVDARMQSSASGTRRAPIDGSGTPPAAGPPAVGHGMARGSRLALLVAFGIGLHNLGEGLAIGAAYSVGALALGALLIIGFALHNTTEGVAIVAPLVDGKAAPTSPEGAGARRGRRDGRTTVQAADGLRVSAPRLALLGLMAGAPAIIGAWIGAAAFNSSVVSFLLGLGVGAIAQVVTQLAPYLRDREARYLHPATSAGLVAGFAVLYATALLVSV
jgi:zinc transporter ZupT